MSEHTQCNHCKYRAILARAQAKRKAVAKARPKDLDYGVDIHVVSNISEELNDKNFVAWMAALPNSCEC